jgi:uncharacterized protein with ParB-like and HNH nuclease domain
MEIYYQKTREILNEITSKIIDEDIFTFITDGILKFVKPLNIQTIDENFETLVNEANEFYETNLNTNQYFCALPIDKKSLTIYQFFKGELPEWIADNLDKNSTDIEYNKSIGNEPYDINSIDIINDKYEVQSLYKKYKLDPQELELSPDYQRNFVWTSKQKSQLIESILIKIPLPIFYIDGRDEDKWIVIDGLQRLTTIFTYIDNDFKLVNLEFLKNLNGKKFKQLERKFQRRIEDFQLFCNFVRPGTPSDIAFNIFTRINTLGTKLEVQEIRNAMYRGKSTKLLSDLSKSDEFIKIITTSKIKSYSKRMEDNAIILRYLAFKIHSLEEYQNNNMDKFLRETMAKINHMKDVEIQLYTEIFRECMKKAKILFNEFNYPPFSKPPKNKDRQNPISKTFFESIGSSLDNYSIEEIEKYKRELAEKLKKLYAEKEFIFKTSVATNNPPNVRYRFEVIENLFKNAIGH